MSGFFAFLAGRKVEVRIITAGYLDDDDQLHMLSDEDSSTFNKMVIAVLVSLT